MSKKDAYYFKHDSNARNDERLLSIRIKHGMAGYGVYWAIVEKLREQKDYCLQIDHKSIAWELHVDEEIVRSVIEDYGLFTIQDGRFYSERLCDDMREWDDKKEARRQAGIRGMKSRWGNRENQPQQAIQTEITIPTPTPSPIEPPQTPKTRSKRYSPEETQLHNECKKIFSDLFKQFKDTDYYWKAKDMAALVGIIKQIRYQMPQEEQNDISIVASNFQVFIRLIFTKANDWTRANATPTVINSKFNEIYTQLKNNSQNGNKQSTESGNARDDLSYVASLVAEIQSGSN